MISSLLLGFFKLLTNAVNFVLAPINLLILNAFPNLNDALNSISTLFNNTVSTYIYFVVDATGITPLALNMVILYWSFALSVPLVVYVIKIAVKWYHYLMP